MRRLVVPCMLIVAILAEGAWLLLLGRGVMWLFALFLSVAASLG
jgi:hypothetical protein